MLGRSAILPGREDEVAWNLKTFKYNYIII